MTSAPGCFIDPDIELETLADPNEKLGIRMAGGYRAIDHAAHLRGQNPIYDQLYDRLLELKIPYEDQCSSMYYFDLVRTLQALNAGLKRVIEVGVFMGGASAIFAGLSGVFNFDLDLVDVNQSFLRFTYERIRRLYPEAAARVRLFHGNLPSYVKHVFVKESPSGCIVHHDASHDFAQVTKDLASLSFVKDRLIAVIAQDTHLRGTTYMNFVDMAFYAVFGLGLKFAPIGTVYEVGDPVTVPNAIQGNYFLPHAPEGMVVPIALNQFQYPHPKMELDQFL